MILPAPAASFMWIEGAGGPALVCEPLAALARHAFTSRPWLLGRDRGHVATDEGWEQVGDAVGIAARDLMHARQVHGSAVSIGRFAAERPEADILVARDAALALAVQAADCVPLLLADPRTGAVAAVHAGWRGLALRVPEAAVRVLEREYGCRPDDLVAAAGPSIGACCYEVGPDVRRFFVECGGAPEAIDRWFRERPAQIEGNPPMRGIAASGREGRSYFDGWAAVRDQLVMAGLATENVFLAGLCTASHPDVLCSFRRDGAGAGRIAGVIRGADLRP